MNALLTTILTSLVNAGADWLRAWVASERAEENAWAAATLKGQLAARDRAQAAAARIDRTPAEAPASPAEWNLGAGVTAAFKREDEVRRAGLLPLVACCLLLSGCFTRQVFVDSDWPIIALPARPVLAVTTVRIPDASGTPVTVGFATDNEKALAAYATALEARLTAYNREAAAHNAEARAAAGAKP